MSHRSFCHHFPRNRSLCMAACCAATLLVWGSPHRASADLMIWNSVNAAGNAQALLDWLAAMEISEGQVDYLVDFETGFTEGQNISGVTGLFPGGLVIRDTGTTQEVIIRSSSTYFGGSNPVGQFSIAHDERPYLELDFSAQAVDYIAFQDIDQAGTSIVVEYSDATTQTLSIETTAAGGDSAEFVGLYRSDMPTIAKVRMDASGDGGWGIDTIRYGSLGDSFILGDMDDNGVLDAFDVDDFELALADKQAYNSQYPTVDPDVRGDMDSSGALDAFDVDDFEVALAGGAAVPEPALLAPLVFGLACIRMRPRNDSI